MADEWIDISVPLRTGMVHWPDNPPVVIERTHDQALGHTATVSKMSLGVHTGTHVDAPRHFLLDGDGIHAAPFAALIGPARVIAITDPHAVTVDELRLHDPQPGERLLFKTLNSARCWQTDEFVEDFVYVSQDAARLLASQRVRSVGVDYLSVGGYAADGVETHQALLGAGIWIIEGLNLSVVSPGTYDLICLPLRIVDGDGAPARAILHPPPSATPGTP
ncbi:MAG TPA: cyclase family protein [Ktedonobacterales bacterium]|jgi:arylformamidase